MIVSSALEAAGYTDEHRYLRVCPNCARLWEGETGSRDRPPAQQCTCDGPPDEWEGWDVSEWARLCDCCLRTVLRSGSRWSVWFCDDCKPRVRALNAALGLPLIPIGRHTLMHGITVGPDAPDIVVDEFSETMLGLFDRMHQLGEWKKQRLGSTFEKLNLTAGVDLHTYLKAVIKSERADSGKAAAFEELATYFGVRLAEPGTDSA